MIPPRDGYSITFTLLCHVASYVVYLREGRLVTRYHNEKQDEIGDEPTMLE